MGERGGEENGFKVGRAATERYVGMRQLVGMLTFDADVAQVMGIDGVCVCVCPLLLICSRVYC